MRADRLISIVLLLETKGILTAKELADELEVSQRTIYRDIDSLSIAGVPIYGVSGSEGGYRLAEGYKNYLNGLNKDEVYALLSLNLPEHFNELEFGSNLKTAILKIRSKYTHLFSNEDKTTIRLYYDTSKWDKTNSSSSHHNIIYNAIYNNKKLSITYRLGEYPLDEIHKIIEPYGLVTKDSKWYMIYSTQGKVRVINITSIISINELNQYFDYPKDFELEYFWKKWWSETEKNYSLFCVKALVPNRLTATIGMYLNIGIVPCTPLPTNYNDEEWFSVELFFDTFEDARSKLLSFGGAVKVIEPESLKYSIIDYAKQIQALYE